MKRSNCNALIAAGGLGLGLLVTLAPRLALAANITVDTEVDAIADGDGCSLREAIIAANTNMAVNECVAGDVGADVIDIPAGVYTLTIGTPDEDFQPDMMGGYEAVVTPDASIGDLDITEDVEITGAGADMTTIEWGTMVNDRIFHVQAPSVDVMATIRGLTVQGGSVDGQIINPGDPEPDQWRFARHGGAIAVGVGASAALAGQSGAVDTGHPEEEEPGGEAALVLEDCVLMSSAAAGDGGGLYAAGPVTATGVMISGNTAGSNGGGIYNDAESTYASCHIADNQGENGGGMFDTGSHSTMLTGSSFVGNVAVGGAGIASRSLVSIVAVNSVFDGNQASDIGGGILTNGTVDLLNCNVYGNVALSDAGFASAGLTTFGGGSFAVESSIVGGNMVGKAMNLANCGCTGGGCSPDITSGGFNIEDASTCGLDQDTDLADTDPGLMPLGDYGGPVPLHALMSNSAALDAASAEDCPATDARGVPRPDGDGCDIGAFELAADEVDGDGDGFCVGLDLGDGPQCLDGSMPGDCDDGEANAFPGNPEVCDGIDNDCNDELDEGLDELEYWPDADGDGFGDANGEPVMACAAPDGTVDDASDCNDGNVDVNPDADEVCDNGIDDDCDGDIDEDCAGGDTTGGEPPGGSSGGDDSTGGDDAGQDDGDSGCSCRTEPGPARFGWLGLLTLGLLRRRRR
ncbi:MAG: choice-of-anchor Q domain-containing protein [Nannocystaceae bacterium]